MARCAICGKEIGIFDSTTSYLDQNGSRVEVHTTCKQQAQGRFAAEIVPQYYMPTVESGESGSSNSSSGSSDLPGWYLAGGVLALALIIGVLIGTAQE